MITLINDRRLQKLLSISQQDDNVYKSLYFNPTKAGYTWITAINGHILLQYRFVGKHATKSGWYKLHKIYMNQLQFIQTQEKHNTVIDYINRLKHTGDPINVEKRINNCCMLHQTTKSQIYTDILARLMPNWTLCYTYFDQLTVDILEVKTITEYQNGSTNIVYFTGTDFKAAIAQIKR